MKGRVLPRRKIYLRLLKEYERGLRRRELNGEIKEVTRKTYLNDAHRVLDSLLAALSADDINAKVGLLYRGYYKKVIKDLKAIMARRTL